MANIKKLFGKTSLAVALILASHSSVSAMTLSGQIEEHKDLSAGNQSAAANAQSSMLKSMQPSESDLNPNSFPRTYLGTWSCETKVTDSTTPQVQAGQTIASGVVFYPTADGRVQARWNQTGWVETQNVACTFGKNQDEAKSDRTTYYFGDNNQGSWAARARDQFAQTAPDTISARSYVDQYIDGQYVGRYRTVSVLKKTFADGTIANR